MFSDVESKHLVLSTEQFSSSSMGITNSPQNCLTPSSCDNSSQSSRINHHQQQSQPPGHVLHKYENSFDSSTGSCHYSEYATNLMNGLNHHNNDHCYHDMFYNGGGGSYGDDQNTIIHQQRPFSAGSSSCSSSDGSEIGRHYGQVFCPEDPQFQSNVCYEQNQTPSNTPAYTSVIVAASQQYPHSINDEFVH